MQDRFKFRVWDKETKKMISYSGVWEHKRPYTETSSFPQYESCPSYHNLSGIMQCIGLRDKNGKLIYEGDIVHKSGNKFNGEKILSQISWCEASAHFVYSDYIGIGGSHEFRTGTAAKMEILGNIYENPELLQ